MFSVASEQGKVSNDLGDSKIVNPDNDDEDRKREGKMTGKFWSGSRWSVRDWIRSAFIFDGGFPCFKDDRAAANDAKEAIRMEALAN